MPSQVSRCIIGIGASSSLTKQRVYVYRNGIQIGVSTWVKSALARSDVERLLGHVIVSRATLCERAS